MLVHIIADYGQGDLAFAEVVQRIKFYLPDAERVLTPVPAFATLAANTVQLKLSCTDDAENRRISSLSSTSVFWFFRAKL